MGRKGSTKHLKRHKSPPHWPIYRKASVWTKRTISGPHSLNTSIPTTIVLRDQLKYVKSAREAKKILTKRKILVDGKPRTNSAFPLGVMDVLQIPDVGDFFRILPDYGGKLKLLPITNEEAQFKLVRIIGKKSLKAGNIQLNLHDGSNIMIKNEQDQFKVNDVLKIKIPNKEIENHIEFKEMQHVIITGGKSQGARGILIGLGTEPGWKKTASIRTSEGDEIRTLVKYIFVVGSNEPIIKLEDEVI